MYVGVSLDIGTVLYVSTRKINTKYLNGSPKLKIDGTGDKTEVLDSVMNRVSCVIYKHYVYL